MHQQSLDPVGGEEEARAAAAAVPVRGSQIPTQFLRCLPMLGRVAAGEAAAEAVPAQNVAPVTLGPPLHSAPRQSGEPHALLWGQGVFLLAPTRTISTIGSFRPPPGCWQGDEARL